jgi:hypothetical protein
MLTLYILDLEFCTYLNVVIGLLRAAKLCYIDNTKKMIPVK